MGIAYFSLFNGVKVQIPSRLIYISLSFSFFCIKWHFVGKGYSCFFIFHSKINDIFAFVQMLDELYEYANMAPGSGPAPTAGPPATPPSLNQLFPWLPTLPPPPPAPPPPSPLLPPPPSPPPPSPPAPSALLGDSPSRPSETVRDILDANQLMRAFLRTMSRDANKVRNGPDGMDVSNPNPPELATQTDAGAKGWHGSWAEQAADGPTLRERHPVDFQTNEGVSASAGGIGK